MQKISIEWHTNGGRVNRFSGNQWQTITIGSDAICDVQMTPNIPSVQVVLQDVGGDFWLYNVGSEPVVLWRSDTCTDVKPGQDVKLPEQTMLYMAGQALRIEVEPDRKEHKQRLERLVHFFS